MLELVTAISEQLHKRAEQLEETEQAMMFGTAAKNQEVFFAIDSRRFLDQMVAFLQIENLHDQLEKLRASHRKASEQSLLDDEERQRAALLRQELLQSQLKLRQTLAAQGSALGTLQHEFKIIEEARDRGAVGMRGRAWGKLPFVFQMARSVERAPSPRPRSPSTSSEGCEHAR